jgi:hypothetical protein
MKGFHHRVTEALPQDDKLDELSQGTVDFGCEYFLGGDITITFIGLAGRFRGGNVGIPLPDPS